MGVRTTVFSEISVLCRGSVVVQVLKGHSVIKCLLQMTQPRACVCVCVCVCRGEKVYAHYLNFTVEPCLERWRTIHPPPLSLA